MANPIPPESRRIVEQRDGRRCVRCGGVGSEWHHRRGRAVRDQHQHCACNGIMLCPTCHAYVHRYPTIAGGLGFIVSRFEPEPSTVPVRSVQGWAEMTCDGHAFPVLLQHLSLEDGPRIVDS